MRPKIVAVIRQYLIQITVLSLALCHQTLAAEAGNIIDEIQKIVDEEVAGSSTPGASVSVVAEGKILATAYSGYSDIESGRKVTSETVFPVASLSKLVTATLMMRQIEQNNIQLDDNANDYLEPEWWVRDSSGRPVDVTIRQLLSHTSGLPFPNSRQFETRADGGVYTLEEFLHQGVESVYAPGKKVIYSNVGFALLGYIAAQESGMDFEDYAQSALLEPLGMINSSFQIQPHMRPNLATLYGELFDDTALATRVDISAVGPAASLHTTADDLAQFALLYLDGGIHKRKRILSQSSIREMFRLQSKIHPNQQDGFGLGFAVVSDPRRPLVGWSGFVPGAISLLILLPDNDLGISILTNAANPRILQTISSRIIDLLLGPVEFPEPVIDKSVDRLEGEYRLVEFPPLPLISVEQSNGLLHLGSPFLNGSIALYPLGSGRFWSPDLFGATVLSEKDRLYIHMFELQRVSPWGSSRALFTYIGILTLAFLILIGY
jgi:CubicO group peptidase (beta-lactamase class C family)